MARREVPRSAVDVVVVARKPGNSKVISEVLEQAGYAASPVSDEDTLKALLDHGGEEPRAALVDVSGFGNGIWQYCEKLQSRGIPFVVISAGRSGGIDSQSVRAGAATVLRKPVSRPVLIDLVEQILDSGTAD